MNVQYTIVSRGFITKMQNR